MNSKLMIAMMLDMGMNREVADVLGELAGVNADITADGHRYLHGPVILHGAPWRDCVPQWMVSAIPGERYRVLHGLLPGHIVGPTELAAVMMPATFEGPLHHELVEMYCWASYKAVCQHYGKDSDIAQSASEVARSKDEDFIGENGQYRYTYENLAHEIRRHVIKHSKWRTPRNGKAEVTDDRPPIAAKVIRLKPSRKDQLSIF